MTVTAITKAAIVTAFAAITLAVGSGFAAAEASAPALGDAQFTTATNPWE